MDDRRSRRTALLSFLVLVLGLPACLGQGPGCPELATRESATSCAPTIRYDGGTYLVMGSCVRPEAITGPLPSENGPALLRLEGIDPLEAVGMAQEEPRCRTTWATYHEVSQARVREIEEMLPTYEAPECVATPKGASCAPVH